MTILFISKQGKSLSVVQRIQEEGHNAYLYVFDRKAKAVGDNIVAKPQFSQIIMTSQDKVLKGNTSILLREIQPDLVVFDEVGMGEVADYIKEQNIPVFGGSKWADYAELNQAYGEKLMKVAGIQTLPTNFSNVDTINLTCEFWWNGLSSYLCNMVINDVRFMNDDLGKKIDCAGAVVTWLSNKNKIILQGLGKLEKLLKKTSYRGPVNLDCLLTKCDLYGVKLGFSFLPMLLELYKGSIAHLLFQAATGGDRKGEIYGGMAIGVFISCPPFPHQGKKVEDVFLNGIEKENLRHLWLSGIMGENNHYTLVTDLGELGFATARGVDIREARRRVYRTLKNLKITDVQYRTDVGLKADGDIRRLKDWGWL